MNFRPALLTRCLVFAALLCALGLQLGETLHSHGADHSAIECLFCKGKPAAPAVAQAGQFNAVPAAAAPVPATETAAARRAVHQPTARGPPQYS